MKLADKTFVVSLRRRHERRDAFRAAMAPFDHEWSFVDAMDGDGMGLSTSKGRTFRRKVDDRPVAMSAGEVGCYLTHLMIVRTALAAGFDSICVMEDDIRWKPDFERRWERFQADLPDDWQLLHLGVQASHWGERKPEPLTAESHVHRVFACWGTYFYVMRREAMRVFAEHGSGDMMEWPADALLYRVIEKVPTYGACADLLELPELGSDC